MDAFSLEYQTTKSLTDANASVPIDGLPAPVV